MLTFDIQRLHARIALRSLVIAAGVVAAGMLSGCDEKVPQDPPRPGETVVAPPAKQETVVQGGGSSLGKARDSAKGIEIKAEEHNRAIEEQLEKMNNGD